MVRKKCTLQGKNDKHEIIFIGLLIKGKWFGISGGMELQSSSSQYVTLTKDSISYHFS